VRAAWGSDDRRANAWEGLREILRSTFNPAALYLTDSGTSALAIALRGVFAATGQAIAVPAYCCFDLATALIGAEVPFLLYDVSASTLSPDLDSLRRALQSGAGSVVVAHLYGVPVDLRAVRLLTSEFGAVVIEDAAQGSGCEWLGAPAGAHGDIGILSFGRGKGVTGGSGGALLVNNPDLALVSASVAGLADDLSGRKGSGRAVARLVAQWMFGRPSLYWIPAALPFLGLGETPFRSPHPVGGMSALAAGVLNHTIRLVPEEIHRRRQNAARLRSALTGAAAFAVPDGWDAGWLRFPVVLQRTARSALTAYHRSLGVMPGYPLALADLPGFGELRGNRADDFSGARLLADRLATIPTHRFVRSTAVPAF